MRFLNTCSCRPVFNVRVIIMPKVCMEHQRCELVGGSGGMLSQDYFFLEPLKHHFMHSSDSKSVCKVKINMYI